MIDETTVEANSGKPIRTVRLHCDGTRETPHERAQTHLFVNEDGATWPDGEGLWEPARGLVEWQYVTSDDAELDESHGRILSSSLTGDQRRLGTDSADDVRARLILKCGWCGRTVRLLRKPFCGKLDQVVEHLPAVRPGEWELDLHRLA